jgi:glycosyltransferase involved in cell wall biosynthesis
VSLKSVDYQIIHLSTGHLGGAGLAARRLNEALNVSGIKSTFAALARKDYEPLAHEISIPRHMGNKILSGILAFLQSKLSKKVFFSLISLNSLNIKLVLNQADPHKTILHIHNWFNFLSMRRILELQRAGFHIVITLHDQRIMTGGCHYPIECRQFERDCNNCPLLPTALKIIPSFILKSSKLRFAKYSPKITFIAPSNWILTEARKSSLLQRSNTVYIPNTLGPVNSIAGQWHHEKNMSSKKTRVGIASMDSKSYIKGGDITSQVSELCKSQSLSFEFVFMNDFEQTDRGKLQFWQAIDFLLVVSRAENSPNVIHEAKELGIPVIASKVGGITELLDLGYDIGIEPEDLNSSSVLGILANLTTRQFSRDMQENMREKFHTYTNQSIVKHMELYEKIMIGG